MSESPLIIRSTHQPLEAVCQRLAEVALSHKFGVLGTHDLRQKMESKGVPFGRECRVIEVCNPQQAQSVLSRSIEVSAALPCRISVYEENGRTILATIKPEVLLGIFDAPSAAPVAKSVEASLTEIMDETVSESRVAAGT